MEKPESTDTLEVQETITECVKRKEDVEEAFQNGLHALVPVERPESTEKPE